MEYQLSMVLLHTRSLKGIQHLTSFVLLSITLTNLLFPLLIIFLYSSFRAEAVTAGEQDQLVSIAFPEDDETLVGDFHIHPKEVDPGLIDDIKGLVQMKCIQHFVRFVSLGGENIIVLIKYPSPPFKDKKEAGFRLEYAVREEEGGNWTKEKYLPAYASIAEPLGIILYQINKGEQIARRIDSDLDVTLGPPVEEIPQFNFSFLRKK